MSVESSELRRHTKTYQNLSDLSSAEIKQAYINNLTMEEKEEPPLVPPQAAEQELHQDPSHQEDMQQQAFLGFGMDPNWGGFGQQMMQPG